MFTIVDEGHEHPGEDEGESGTQEQRTPETEFLGDVAGARRGNQLVQIAWLRPVLCGGLPQCGLETFPLPVEDLPVERLREEDDDDQAGSTDAGDAHDELLVGVQDPTNEAGYSSEGVGGEKQNISTYWWPLPGRKQLRGSWRPR